MERSQFTPEAANDNAAFDKVLDLNEAADAARVDRSPNSHAAQMVAALMRAAAEVNLQDSNSESGRAKFEQAA